MGRFDIYSNPGKNKGSIHVRTGVSKQRMMSDA